MYIVMGVDKWWFGGLKAPPPPQFLATIKKYHRKMVLNKVYCIKNVQTVFFYYHYGIQKPSERTKHFLEGHAPRPPYNALACFARHKSFKALPPPL